MSPANSSNRLWRRRDLIKALGATAIAAPSILRGTTARAATSKVIKIGHVTPTTGALAPFAETDPFILDQIRNAVSKGISNGGSTYQVEIITKDSQSKTNRASFSPGGRARKKSVTGALKSWKRRAYWERQMLELAV